MNTCVETPDYYDAGKEVGRLLLFAFEAAHLSVEAASDIATGADRKLWPLIEVNDPEQLRDFIAGLVRTIEEALAARGVLVDTSVPIRPLSERYLRLEALLAQQFE